MATSKHVRFLNANRHLYEPLFEQQGGVCAICKRPPKKRRLDMDHDHRAMYIRGLLCVRCNRALPSWVTPEWLEEAAKYLRKGDVTVG